MWTKIAWLIGSFYGMTGIILGAFGAHALRSRLTERLLESYQVGARYQLTHAIVLIFLALLVHHFPSNLLNASIVLIATGTLLFSGSIYALTLAQWKVGIITPIGGLLLIIGWLLLFIAGFSFQK